MAKVVAVNISTVKGVRKHTVPSCRLVIDHGIEGDAHAGNWHRQVSLLARESIDKMQARLTDIQLHPGDFAENITTSGIAVMELPIGTRLKVGKEAELEVTQIGKACHMACEIRNIVGDCVMPREGIFAIVTREGTINPGDRITVIAGGNKAGEGDEPSKSPAPTTSPGSRRGVGPKQTRPARPR
jgi:MOSC domain-containing protein YiiM